MLDIRAGKFTESQNLIVALGAGLPIIETTGMIKFLHLALNPCLKNCKKRPNNDKNHQMAHSGIPARIALCFRDNGLLRPDRRFASPWRVINQSK